MRVVLHGGAGGVGAALAYNLLRSRQAHELVVVDPREATAASHALDYEQVLEQGGRGSVRAGDLDDVALADVVVVAASVPLRPNVSRLVFLADNARIVAPLADAIADAGPGWAGVVVVVTNPVDPLVMLLQQRSGLDRRRVIGYTLNDSLRLRSAIAHALRRPPGGVDAWVLGEHGDALVPLFSRVRIDGAPYALNPGEQATAHAFVHGWYARHVALDQTRSSTWTSSTGIADLIGAMARDEPTLMPASVVLDGEYGLHGVSLGVPVIVRHGGVTEILEWALAASETAALHHAATVIRAAAQTIVPVNGSSG